MATKRWRGDAVAVAQESRATPANVAVGDVFTLTINGKSVSFTATAASVANVTAGLTTAWNDSTIPELAEVTASDATTYVKLLADTKGKPFTVTATSTGDGVPADTLTISTPTVSSGPNHWDTAANWDASGVPAGADDVYIEGKVDILYGIDQNAVTLTSLNIGLGSAYSGKIGLPLRNNGGYDEYREDYLKISATTVNVGSGYTGGRLKLNTGAAATTIFLSGTGQSAETGLESMIWVGTHVANVVNVEKGSFGAAVLPGETATIATLRISHAANTETDADVRCGTGVTLTTIDKSGGVLETNSAATTVTTRAGNTYLEAGAHTTVHVQGGTVYYNSVGTITTLNVLGAARVEFARDLRTRTVTTTNLYRDGAIVDSAGKVTFTNGVVLQQCRLTEVTLDFGPNRTLTPS